LPIYNSDNMEYSEKEQKYKNLALKLLNGKSDKKKLSQKEIEIILNILSWKVTEERELIKDLCGELIDRKIKFD